MMEAADGGNHLRGVSHFTPPGTRRSFILRPLFLPDALIQQVKEVVETLATEVRVRRMNGTPPQTFISLNRKPFFTLRESIVKWNANAILRTYPSATEGWVGVYSGPSSLFSGPEHDGSRSTPYISRDRKAEEFL